jgi:fumarate hydratase subunit alpha
MIPQSVIKKTTKELLFHAVTELPPDIKRALSRAYRKEESEIARIQLRAILENIRIASREKKPLCQDTGIPIFYVWLGKVKVKNLEEGIREGVAEATEEIPLRPNVVTPIGRKSLQKNVGERMPYINYKFIDGQYLELAVLPKGAGSENMSFLAMLTPREGIDGIKKFVLKSIITAGGMPCPPVVVGIGIGGSADIAMKLAKEALLRPLDERNPSFGSLEEELFNLINQTGVGPMGLGGRTTCLGVLIETAECHTASLPVAVNLQCWAARKARARIYKNGEVVFEK